MLRDLGADPVRIQMAILARPVTHVLLAPELERFSVDLTRAARNGQYDPVAARDSEIAAVFRILESPQRESPVLVGKPGVGKTAIAEEIARRIAADDMPLKRLVRLDTGALIAGAARPGDFEKRLTDLLHEVRRHRDLLLFIDDIDTLAGLGAPQGALDALRIVQRALTADNLRILAATTPELYRKYLQAENFSPVFVEEPTPEAALAILQALRTKYEAHHEVQISDGALAAAVELSGRIVHRSLPDKAIDLMDEAAATVRIRALYAQTGPENEEELTALMQDKEDAILAEAYEVAAELYAKELKLRERLAEYTSLRKEDGPPLVTERDIREIIAAWFSDDDEYEENFETEPD